MSIKSASEHQSGSVIKMLLLGDSGTGKTGALASLVEDYKVTVLDFDNGLDFLVRQIKKSCPKSLSNLTYETFTDEMVSKGDRIIPKGRPKAYANCIKTLDELNLREWKNDRVLVLDSLTFFCQAALNYYRYMNNTLATGKTDIRDYGQAMGATENFLAHVQSHQANFHYIVISHLQYMEIGTGGNTAPVSRGLKPAAIAEESKQYKAFPSALGKKLPPTVATYFNTSLMCSKSMSKRIIRTDSKGIVDLKSGAPDIPKELPLATGLKDFFNLILGVA